MMHGQTIVKFLSWFFRFCREGLMVIVFHRNM